MHLKFVLFAALSLGLAVPAQAQDAPAVFKPNGNWTADFGDDYCRLIRTFSDGTNQLSLALERTQPGEFTRLVFVGDGLKPYRRAAQLGYRFLPSGNAAKSRYVRGETSEGKPFLGLDPVTLAPIEGISPITSVTVVQRQNFAERTLTPPQDATPTDSISSIAPYDRVKELETARGITAVALDEGLTSPVRFETGSLGAPIEVMQACTDDLLKVWGLDVDRHKSMTAVAMPNANPSGVLPNGTIPFTEFAKFAGGANQVRLIVSAEGKPTSCTIYSPTLDQALNERICKLFMEGATFQPAQDAAGQPMASYWMGPVFPFGPPLVTVPRR